MASLCSSLQPSRLAKTLESLSAAVGQHYDELMESQHGLCSPCYARNSSTVVVLEAQVLQTVQLVQMRESNIMYWDITCRIQ